MSVEKKHPKPAKTEAGDTASTSGENDSSSPKQPFFVVGIGASAGGLEAIEQLFKTIPSDSGMAFIIVQHLDPDRQSSMPEIMTRLTKMPVNVASDGMKVEPNSIYLNPPDRNIRLENSVLFLEKIAEPHSLRLPIDFFLRSLAKDQGATAIAVILSGTGTDGTLGMKAVKAEAGTTFVQSPESAKYNGMPLSAIGTGMADFILSPVNMPPKLIEFAGHVAVNGSRIGKVSEKSSKPLQQVFAILSAKTGHDFSHYKLNTVCRRLERRMSVNGIDDLPQYANYLKENEAEAKALMKDLLISVTSFFRDAEAFGTLKEKLCKLMQDKAPGSDLRVWIAGCATGEEAYSIAIAISECMEQLDKRFQVQMYGTDIDLDALNVARKAIYPANIAADVTPQRLQHFFLKQEHAYQIKKALREMVVFAPQNFIKDPPFSRMDLICCRNLLIYLESDIQKTLLPLLHYSLKPGGLLFLGTSETVGDASDLFTTLDKKWKIYQRKESPVSAERLKFPSAFIQSIRESPAEMGAVQSSGIPALTEKIFLDNYASTFAVIDEKYRLIYVRGRTGKYLEIASGQPKLSIMDLAREGLRSELSSAIYEANSKKKTIVRDGVQVQFNGNYQIINLTVAPLTEEGVPPGLMMVVFQEVFREGKLKVSPERRQGSALIEEELNLTKRNLQKTIEELEAANEELKSANEELQSNNEELQSTNEELDTSREELQSINEELMTVNAELSSKTDMLIGANDDLKNYLNRTDIAIIFLDIDLNIRSFTTAATDVFSIRSIDIGRPFQEITSRLSYLSLIDDSREVLRNMMPKESEVQRRDGHWYNMRILPYFTVQNSLGGLVLSFLDVDKQRQSIKELASANAELHQALQEQKNAEKEKESLLQESNERLNELQTLLDNAPVAVWIARDPQCLNITGNIFANRLFGVRTGDNISKSAPPDETANSYKVIYNNRELKPEELPAQVAAASGNSVAPYEMELVLHNGLHLNMMIGAVPLIDSNGRVRGSISIGMDITERKIAEDKLKTSEEKYRNLFTNMTEGFALCEIIIDSAGKPVDYRALEVNRAWEAQTGLTGAQVIGKGFKEMIPDLEQYWVDNYGKVALTGEPMHLENYNQFTDHWYEIYAYSPRKGYFVTLVQNITGRKKVEEALKESEERFRAIADNTPDHILVQDAGLRYTYAVNPQMGLTVKEMLGKTDYDILAKEDADKLAAIKRQVISTGKPFHLETSLVNKAGKLEHFSGAYVPKYDLERHADGLIGYFQNVTDRKNAEEALKENEARFRWVMRHSPVSVAVQDIDLKYIWAYNQQTALMDQIIGRYDHEIFTPEEAARITALKRRVIDEDINLNDQMWLNRPGGRIFLAIYWEPIHDEAGRVIGVGSTTVDLTPVKAAEEALRESEERFHTLADAMPQLVWTANPDGIVDYYNARSVEYSVSANELADHDWTPALHPDDVEPTLEAWRNAVARGAIYQKEQRLRVADGSYRWHLARAKPQFDKNGNIIKWFGATTDIHDLKMAEETLSESEARANALIQYAPTGIFEIDFRGPKFLSINNATLKLTGYSKEEMFALGPLGIFDDDSKKIFSDRIKLQLAGEKLADSVEYRMIRKDGTRAFIVLNVAFSQTNPGTALVIGHDVTERKNYELEILRLNRELQAIIECDQAITHASDEHTLYSEICRILCTSAGYLLAWVASVENDEVRSMRPIAWCGDEEYVMSAHITWADNERGRGPTGLAARRNKTCYFQDFATESAASPWRKAALSKGYRSSIALPLVDNGGKVLTVLTLYAAKPNHFNSSEIKLLETLASDLAFGINGLQEQQKRQQAEAEITHLASFPMLNPNPILELDFAGNLKFANPAAKAAFPLGPADRKQAFWLDLFAAIQKEKAHSITRDIAIGDLWYEQVLVFTPPTDSYLLYGRNITPRVEAEEKLQETRRVLEKAQQIAHIGSWEWNIVTGELKWSQELYAIYGVDPASFVPSMEAFGDFIHPADREYLNKVMNQLITGGQPIKLDFRIVLRDSSIRYVHTTSEILTRDNSGKPVVYVGTTQDITERKKAEEAIQRYTQELETYRTNLEEKVNQRTQELQSLSYRLISLQEEERRSISRELHDQIGQSLTVLNLLLAKALRSPETSLSDIKEAQQSVKEVLSQVRNLSSSLHPGMLEDLGLLSTLNWYLNDFSKKTGININFTHSGLARKFPRDINITIYRIIQEALTNIARYAEVKETAVSLRLENQIIFVRVEDKGKGFKVESQPQGVGLKGMRERVNALKGNLKVNSRPGEGTIIAVELPFPND